jgi:hypothetical protein
MSFRVPPGTRAAPMGVRRQALDAGWTIPLEFPLQDHYIESG